MTFRASPLYSKHIVTPTCFGHSGRWVRKNGCIELLQNLWTSSVRWFYCTSLTMATWVFETCRTYTVFRLCFHTLMCLCWFSYHVWSRDIFLAYLAHMPSSAVVKLFFRKTFDVITLVRSLLLLYLFLLFWNISSAIHIAAVQIQGER